MLTGVTPPAAALDTGGDLLTADEVIGRLLGDEDLRRAAATCVLPAVRCGGAWKFRASDLDAWILRHRREQIQATAAGERTA